VKIAIITDQPHWTGIGKYALELFELLKPHIHDLKLIYAGAVDDDFPNQEKLEYMKRTRHYLDRPILIKINYKKLLKDQNLSDYLFHYVGTEYCGLKKRRGIITVHDVIRDKWWEDSKLNLFKILNGLERMRKLRDMLKLSKYSLLNISISKKTQNEFKKLTGMDSVLIHHWISNDKFRRRNRMECLKKLRLSADYKYILSVGNDRPNKRTDLIEKFVDSLPQEFRLIKIGAPIKSLKSLNIAYVNDDVYPLYFNVSDAYLHLSDDEGFGLPLIEALGSDTPVICRNTEINNEILGDVSIKISETDISYQTIDVISKLDDPSFYKELLKGTHERKSLFEAPKSSEMYLNAYKEAWNSWCTLFNHNVLG